MISRRCSRTGRKFFIFVKSWPFCFFVNDNCIVPFSSICILQGGFAENYLTFSLAGKLTLRLICAQKTFELQRARSYNTYKLLHLLELWLKLLQHYVKQIWKRWSKLTRKQTLKNNPRQIFLNVYRKVSEAAEKYILLAIY